MRHYLQFSKQENDERVDNNDYRNTFLLMTMTRKIVQSLQHIC